MFKNLLKMTTNIVKQAVSKAKTTKKAITSTVEKKTQPLVTKLAQTKPIQYIAKDPGRHSLLMTCSQLPTCCLLLDLLLEL